MSDEEREIILKGTKIVAGGRSIKLTNIVVRRGVPLPALGERVVGIDEKRVVKFAGNVTRVDPEKWEYDVELRKSFVSPAHECTERDSFAGRVPSHQDKEQGNGTRRVV